MLENWNPVPDQPLLIAGPCSAETEEQLTETALALVANGVKIIRAGVWKPRTRPGSFEGKGEEALQWFQKIRQQVPADVKFAVEVANAEHVQLALRYGIDILWVGARSSVNPFTMQEIADSLKGVDIPVLVKNPINPDLALWIGALERLAGAGITKLAAIHRGFSSHKKTKFRNVPSWQLPLELKREFPELPIICDPSHIAGVRELVPELSQKAMDINFDGLMIESHCNPSEAWSDASQQVTPSRLKEIVDQLRIPTKGVADKEFNSHLVELREKIDQLDREIFDLVAERMAVVDQIGAFKKKSNVTVFQINRWNEILKTRSEWADELNLDHELMEAVFNQIHESSIKRQMNIMAKKEADV
ncbi:MAG: bifunctional 3-deoxy-7-phosphoheptulonate synthase/chorismate mutase type II [Cytophagales bacterium]|nr:bifunctional 3-deoxy-7-phosphoheptulonate synthase/chorismate mutase type II [Cytophagales bacterium]